MAADKRAARLGVLGLVAALLFGALGTRLWFLQTVEAESLQETVDLNRTRTRQIAPERGRVFDADGRVLADNRRVLTVKLDWSSMRRDTDRAALFTRLSPWLEMPVGEMEARYDSGKYSRYEPMPLREDVSRDVALALRERIEDFPGLIVDTEWERVYPYAPLASHVVGYMGSITEEDQERYRELGYDTSDQGERVGRAGVEGSMEEVLHGQWGEVVYEVDSSNRIVREISYKPPVNGQDIQLTIDLDLQQYAERLLYTQLILRRLFTAANPPVRGTNGTVGVDRSRPVGAQVYYKAPAGSITVMNQNTGEVLAMASYPRFDNRWFNADIDDAKFAEIFPTENPDGSPLDTDLAPLPNRAVQGQYNMGSTFKVFTAYSAMVTGMLSPNTVFDDRGTYTIKSIDPARCQENGGPIRCTYRNSTCPGGLPCEYGPVNAQQSLAVSSDAFYYALGEQFYETPGTPFQDQLHQLGFGEDPGIDLPHAYDGRVPTNESKAALVDAGVLAEGEVPNITPGDLLQTSIGQGLMAASPIQMAVGYAAIANGGNVLRPHVVQRIYAPGVPNSMEPAKADLARGTVVEEIAPEVRRTVPMPEEVRAPIVNGLRHNITGPRINGRSTTAEELFADYPATAIQIAGKTGTAQGYNQYPWNDSSAFAAMSLDAERPFTVVSYLEKAGFGSTGAAPVVKCMYLALSGLPVEQGGVVVDPVPISDPLDLTSTVPAPDPQEVYVNDCMKSTNAGTITPVD